MIIFIDYLILIINFFIGLYRSVDEYYMLSSSGAKLKKYINNVSLQDMTRTLGNTQNKSYISFVFSSLTSPKKHGYKHYANVMLISTSIMAMKVALTYKFLVSNIYYIEVFNKTIYISSILEEKYIVFKIFYYVLSLYSIFYVISKILIYISNKKSQKLKKEENKNLFKINIGKTESNEDVIINKSGAFQNVLITGSIGSGKTSSAISNILDELIRNKLSGLIIDVKGNYINTVKKIVEKYNVQDKLIEISLNSPFCYNPLNQDISPLEMASILKKVLVMMSGNSNSDPFWLDKAESYIRDFLIIIRAIKPYVTLYDIHSAVNDKEFLNEQISILKKNILSNKYSDEELFNINSAFQNILNEYYKLDDRTLNIIRAEITRITDVFASDYNIYNKFCSKGDKLDFLSGKIIVLSIDIGSNKKIAKLISTYLKLEFQRQVLSSKNSKETFFICDEYQEFANEEDAHFFSISREYKCINVISMQSFSSLTNTLKNDKAAAVIIQNLVNKIFFRNDDVNTIQETIKLIGKEVKATKSISINEGGDNARYNVVLNNFKSYKTSLGQSYMLAEKEEYMINEDYFSQELKSFETLCLISDGAQMRLYKKVKMKGWFESNEESKLQ